MLNPLITHHYLLGWPVLTSNVMCHRVSILNAIILNYHIQTNGKYMYIHIYIHACMHTYIHIIRYIVSHVLIIFWYPIVYTVYPPCVLDKYHQNLSFQHNVQYMLKFTIYIYTYIHMYVYVYDCELASLPATLES